MPTHSHGEKLSLAAFWDSLEAADRKAREWLEGPRIGFENVNRGGPAKSTGAGQLTVEKLSAGDWWRAAGQKGGTSYTQSQSGGDVRGDSGGGFGPQNGRTVSDHRAVSGAVKRTMGFGKYRDRLMADVAEEDPRYFDWACQEVSGFEQRARELGLIDE